MRIHLLYFAVVRERLGRDEETLEIAGGTTARGLIDLLAARDAPIAALRHQLQIAVNEEMVAGEKVLREGDEVALIPPVAGGSGMREEGVAHLSRGALSLDELVARVASPAHGAIVTFTGVVRGSRGTEAIRWLEYEAYEPMAERTIRAILAEIEREWPGASVAALHRLGRLAPGELAVLVAAAAPHRAEAFAAGRAAIDRIKEKAPIWKKEVGEQGAEWVGLSP